MISPNTPEELSEAHIAICHMRGIDPEAKIKPSPKLEVRDRIESLLEQRAIDNGDYELHSIHYTSFKNLDPEKKKQLSEAAKRSQFGKPYCPRR